jgi:hypothetical protein
LTLATSAAATGRRVKLEGQLAGDDLVVHRVKERDPRRDPARGRVAGTILRIDPAGRVMRLGPVLVAWGDETTFDEVDAAALAPGRTVEVEGVEAGWRGIRAKRIAAAAVAPGAFEILGAVTETERTGDGDVLTVFGVRAYVPDTLRPSPLSLARDPDDRRPEDQLQVTVLGRPLTVGGEVGTRLGWLGDPALDDDEDDDELGFETELELELFYPWSSRLAFFLSGKAAHERDLATEDGDRDHVSYAERGESWVFLSGPETSGFALQLGRQAFREEREWWWDEDLDAVRLWWTRFPFGLQLGVARELLPASTEFDGIDPEEEDVLRTLVRASWSWRPGHQLDLFGLGQWDDSGRSRLGARMTDDDEDLVDGDLAWVGLRSSGEEDLPSDAELRYWIDLAHVRGREWRYGLDDDDRVDRRVRQRVSGWATDLGATLRLPTRHRPAFTLGYAFGSGDAEEMGRSSRAFRQTGLQDNNGKFRGVDRFRYYGELFDPELSNLHVVTAALGFRFWESSSVELLYHFYRQHRAAAFLRDTRLDAEPLGRSKTLGHELDLVIGLEEWEHFEVEVVAALFRAGSAFGSLSGELSYGGFLKVDYNF